MHSNLKIKKNIIGDDYKPFIIAEVGQSHSGSLKRAIRYIRSIAETGVDAIKFQTHIASDESTLDEPFRVSFSKKYKSRYDYWKAMEFTEKEWKKISNYCKKKKIIFLSSPFSLKAVKLLKKINIPAWKIASGEFFSEQMLEEIYKTKKPLLISTGMSKYSEIYKIVKKLKKKKIKFLLFQCTSEYPSNKENIGLNIIDEFKKKFKCPAGLSDHSGNLMTLISAIASGSNAIECHIKLNGPKNNPDFSSSISLKELKFLVEFKNYFYELKNAKINKSSLSKQVKKNRKLFLKSLAPIKSMKKGEIVKADNITEKKPGTGINIKDKNKIIGKKILKNIKFNQLFKWEFFA